ncbi:AAA family ATPase [Pseudophaeobacter sp.]|uniref:AAA family ATPase n=1 Tax=Pseudophaeobacter sp. TaxID=1971739 RepID=UPI0032972AFB
MQISYAVENIRRLESVSPIEVRPITILVGRNSAGKSTFLRSLPLIRQSLETRSSAPILWFGDSVDFGDFQTAVSNGENSREAVFSFKLTDMEGRYRANISHNINYSLGYRFRAISVDEINIRYFVAAEGEKTFLRRITFDIPGEDIYCEIFYKGRSGVGGALIVNGDEVLQISQNYEIFCPTSDLFSSPSLI